MTRYFYDTEFLEDGRTIDLISIGIVADDGREYYAVNAAIASELNVHGGNDELHKRICTRPWLMTNVVKHLPLRAERGYSPAGSGSPNFYLDDSDPSIKPKWVIANEVRAFVRNDMTPPELWADYGAYDHIVLMQLFGNMMQRPSWFPMWTHDLQQALEAARILDADELCHRDVTDSTPHHALEDARHLKRVWDALHLVFADDAAVGDGPR